MESLFDFENFDQIKDKDKTYTVLELNTSVRAAIEREFSSTVWVCGEIQGLRPDRSKRHTYFELVQKSSAGDDIVAKVKVALFAGRQPVINSRIRQTNGAFELKNDIEVRFLCEVSVHPPTGQYSLIIIDIDTVYTLGKVAQTRIKILEDLKKRGLLDKNKQRQISLVPLNIGLITARDSAAYHDFTNELALSGFSFKLHVFNAHMQGKQVESDIVKALTIFNGYPKDCLDAIVITRGGGSTADLAWFDNKKIAETIADSIYPVISALGHQIDTTITDLVASATHKTPTKAAQFFVERVSEFSAALEELEESILKAVTVFLDEGKDRLQKSALKIDARLPLFFRFHRETLINAKNRITNLTTGYLTDKTQEISRLSQAISSGVDQLIKDEKNRLNHIAEKVKLLDPKKVLKRGYSLTYSNGKLLKSVKDANPSENIETVLKDGTLVSKITRIE
ncbi:MAG: exodeoxyribonuclease VII large subunit [Candidatus Omnitrophica bacterium]|nr:exodeoxyribonuclease VII large subunit [Candidatus Omnitrophota bacterium]